MSRSRLLLGAAALLAAAASAVGWQRAPGATVATAAVATIDVDGAIVFRAKGCASCHDGPESEAMIGGFPSLADAPSWAGTRVPGQSAHDYVWDSIRLPHAVIAPGFVRGGGPAHEMPTLRLTDTELAAVVSYLLDR